MKKLYGKKVLAEESITHKGVSVRVVVIQTVPEYYDIHILNEVSRQEESTTLDQKIPVDDLGLSHVDLQLQLKTIGLEYLLGKIYG